MRKISLFAICFALLMAVDLPVFAESTGVGTAGETGDLIAYADEFITRSSTTTSTRNREFTCDGKTIAEIAITGSFRFNGSVVEVISKSISKSVTYDGWTFQKSSFISSGGSIVLTGTLTKSGKAVNVSISLSCDPDGNIY